MAMFTSDMADSDKKEITITKYSYKVMYGCLLFIYSGELENVYNIEELC